MKRLAVSFCILFFLPSTLFAQSELVDTELWTGIAAKMKLNKKFKIELEEQFRFKDTVQTYKSSFTELSLRYKINKRFSLKTSYRYSVRTGYRQRNRNRMSLFVYYYWDKKKFPISIQLRTGFQNDIEVFNGQLITFSRNQIKLKYKSFKNSKPFISYESFYRFNDKNEFRGNRFTVGISWDFTKAIALTGFYRLEQEINVKGPERQHIGGIMFTYSFKY